MPACEPFEPALAAEEVKVNILRQGNLSKSPCRVLLSAPVTDQAFHNLTWVTSDSTESEAIKFCICPGIIVTPLGKTLVLRAYPASVSRSTFLRSPQPTTASHPTHPRAGAALHMSISTHFKKRPPAVNKRKEI